LITRLISSETGLSSEKLRTGNLADHEWKQLNVKVGDLEKAPIYIDDTPALSIFDLRAKARRMASQFKIKLIVVDYLQLMTAGNTNKSGNREQEISTISRNLKSLAKELDIPVIESPNEFTLDAAYSLKLNDNFGLGVAGRFLLSDVKLQSFDSESQASTSVAVDISGFFKSDVISLGRNDGILRAGFNISNLGPKMKYSDLGQENFIPSNLRIGSGFEFLYDSNNSLSITIEVNKLLVPTPNVPIYDSSNSEIIAYKQSDIGFLSGIFKSFNDAPDGFSEELKELTYSLGLEYSFNKSFFFTNICSTCIRPKNYS